MTDTSKDEARDGFGCLGFAGIAFVMIGAESLDRHEWFSGVAAVALGVLLLVTLWRAR